MRRALFGLLVLVAACSGGVDAISVVASSPGSVGVGTQRVLIALVDQQTGEFLAKPDLTPIATLRDGIGSPIDEYEGTFVWTVPDVRGLYAFQMDIPGASTYQITIEAGDLGELAPVGLVSVADPFQVSVGDEAPRSDTRTLTDADIGDLSSDPTPVETFYEKSVADAVAAGPSAIVFATPAWCISQTCGPILDQVQEVAPEYPSVSFVHVEVYENIHVTNREDLKLVPAVDEWGLPSEPWLYVTDVDGVVTAAFEGALSEDELRQALDAVTG